MNYSEALKQTNERFIESGFDRLPLEEQGLPTPETTENGTQYVSFGPEDAPHVFLVSTPYLTDLSPHYLLRLKGQQLAIGDDARVVGFRGYHFDNPLTRSERRLVKTGDFSPMAKRALGVVEELQLRDGQAVIPYGPSMAADIAFQTAYTAQTDANAGVIEIAGVGGIEAARTVPKRNILRVAWAMNKSGRMLHRNIANSNVTALEEAWGWADDDTDELRSKKLDKQVQADVDTYIKSDKLGAVALIRGFGTDETVRQAEFLARYTRLPIFAGRASLSTVCSPDFTDKIAGVRDGIHTYVDHGNDHSLEDDTRSSAARMTFFRSYI